MKMPMYPNLHCQSCMLYIHLHMLQADTTIAPVGNVPNATRPGQKLNITALVGNASPSSIAYPDGEVLP